ncbi:MAG: CoA-binding protein, partial [Candidatus Hodarchaeota archaeon]
MEIDFTPLFYPKSIAVYGAKENRAGYITPFQEFDYQGKLFLISDAEDEVFGIKCYKSIFDFPDPIDFVIIAIRREYVLQAIKDCKKKGVKFVHIFTAGFSEKDSEGKEIEDKILEVINKEPKGPRIIGPNCMGLYSPEGRLSFGPSFSRESGPVGVISQSGALAYRFAYDGMYRGFRFSKMISLGNSIDLTILDFLKYLNQDPKTKIICIYSEGLPLNMGKSLLNILKNVKKPVIILKGGVSEVGKRAAKSHTGSIASDINVWNSIFKQTSAIPVESLTELADLALAFSYTDILPKSKRTAIVSFSGGISVIGGDLCTKLGLEIPQFTKQIREEMRKYFPPWVEPQNPLDLPSTFRKARMLDIYRNLAESDFVDSVIIQAPGRLADPYW